MRASDPPVELLDWDTDFWGFRVGRVVGRTLDAAAAATIDAWAAAQKVACVFLCAEDEPGTVSTAQGSGFRLVEPRVTMTYRRGEAIGGRADPRVREHDDADLPELRALARRTRYVSRFAFDPRFAPRAADYFEAWVAASCSGFADAVLVHEDAGAVSGYITCRLPAEGRDSSFGIVAVDPAARERGVGTALLDAGVRWLLGRGMKTVSVGVAARNLATLRYVERYGFMASAFELWFHKWYDEA